MHKVVDHVRAHLEGDLGLHALAKVAGFSPHHFHRVFKTATGETLAEFTRRARLERAAYLMMGAPSRTLISIALETGFASHSDLSRAFRRLYGIAPAHWDRTTRLAPSSLPEPPKQSTPSAPLQPRIESHAACRLAYIRMRAWFVGDALARGYATLTHWLDERGIDWRERALLGLSWDNYETTPLDQVCFDFGFSVPKEVRAEGEIGIHEFPALRSVDVHCSGGLPRVAEAWDYLYETWLPASGYEPDDLPGIKRFRTRPDQPDWDTWDLDCSIAIRPLCP